MLQLGKSEKAFDEAKRYMPGGVNSPVRSYRSVGSNPPLLAPLAVVVSMISITTSTSTTC